MGGTESNGRQEADRWGPGNSSRRWFDLIWISNRFKRFQIKFKSFQTLTDPKKTFPSSKIEIKYGCEGFGESNNFVHRKFFIFEIEFELKIWGVKVRFGL
jgi:hypothetical protein